jgi:hypothetical protein
MGVMMRRLIATAFLFGCGYANTEVPGARDGSIIGFQEKASELSYANVRSQVLQPYCLRCHSEAGGNRGRINLETFANTKNLIGPIQSVVSGGQMPPSGSMPASARSMLLQWIEAGAPEVAGTQPPPTSPPSGGSPIPCEDHRHRIEQGLVINIDRTFFYDVLANAILIRRDDCHDELTADDHSNMVLP